MMHNKRLCVWRDNSHRLKKCSLVLRLKNLPVDFESIKTIEAADEFAAEFYVGDLVFAYRDE